MPRRTEDQWFSAYETRDALWAHDGNPKRPHAVLRAGEHTCFFFDSKIVMAVDRLAEEAASDLVDKFIASGGSIVCINRVVGPATGATKLAQFLAEEIARRNGKPCDWASPIKQGEGKDMIMVFDDPNQTVMPHEHVIQCEDVVTTGLSVGLASDASKKTGGVVYPYTLALVNRSGLKHAHGKRIIALITKDMPKWQPSECPLCAKGSEAILSPKRPDNWARLTAKY